MDREYVRVYSELYERHWWWRARETLLLDLIRRRCPEGGYGSILDIGCGNGLFFGKLREFGEPEGVEADPAWREFGRPSPAQVHYRVFDSTFQPEKRYGLILMLDLIEHLDDPAGALHHAVNLLTGDGKLIVTVPAFLQLWTSHDDLNHHVTRFTRGSFLPIARQAGMSIETMRYFFHWLFFAKAAVRLKESLAKPARPETPGIPPAWINGLLTTACEIENSLLAPLAIPFGGSLLAIGGRSR